MPCIGERTNALKEYLRSQEVSRLDVVDRVESQVKLLFSCYESGDKEGAYRSWLSLGGVADRIMPMLKLLHLCSLEHSYFIAKEMQSLLAASVVSRYTETKDKLGLHAGTMNEVRIQAQLATIATCALNKRIARGKSSVSMDAAKKMRPYELLANKVPVVVAEWDYSLLDESECAFEVRVRSKGENVFTYAGDFEFALEAVYFAHLLQLQSECNSPCSDDTVTVHPLSGVDISAVGMSALMSEMVKTADVDVLKRLCAMVPSLLPDEGVVN